MARRRIGLHVRLTQSILEPIRKAQQLQLPFFQCFFVLPASGKLVEVSTSEMQSFLVLRRQHFDQLFFHGSYWINLASLGYNGYRFLKRELNLAKQLEFNHMILHPGTAKGATQKKEGIDALARALNRLFTTENDIGVILENTAHGNLSVGSDMLDFQQLLEKIDYPEKISFCIDTSHAYSFGYDIAHEREQDMFIDFLNNSIGIDRIKLIHLNDSQKKLGSRIDQHAVVGQGNIGALALKRFILHPKLAHIPVIMELPDISADREMAVLQKVRSWVGEE